MTTLYNEWDPYAAEWLRNLSRDGLIAPGVVDDRSITEITPAELADVRQFHAFAGIGGWSAAARLAGIPDDFPIWTGSCPCQSLSDAGAKRGFLDPRHLWPAWYALIQECRPPVIAGEQVASQLGLEWLDLVFADLERCGYAVGAADLGAAGLGAPHIRQRLWFIAVANDDQRGRTLVRQTRLHDHWKPGDHPARCGEVVLVADRAREGCEGAQDRPERGGIDGAVSDGQARGEFVGDPESLGRAEGRVDGPHGRSPLEPDGSGADSVVVHANGTRLEGGDGGDGGDGGESRPHEPTGDAIDGPMGDADREREGAVSGLCAGAHPERARSVGNGGMGDTGSDRARQHAGELPGDEGQHDLGAEDRDHSPIPPGATGDFWTGCDWVWCRDGVYRPIKPGTFPLAHGVSGRMAVRRTIQQAATASQEDGPAVGAQGSEAPQEGQGVIEHWYNRTGALSGCGNAIVRQVAAAFLQASFEAISDLPDDRP